MTLITENQKSKPKSLSLTLDSSKLKEGITVTEIAEGELSLGDLILLEEEDMRLQYKHLNLSYYDR